MPPHLTCPSQQQPCEVDTSLFPLNKWESWNAERGSRLSKLTQLVGGSGKPWLGSFTLVQGFCTFSVSIHPPLCCHGALPQYCAGSVLVKALPGLLNSQRQIPHPRVGGQGCLGTATYLLQYLYSMEPLTMWWFLHISVFFFPPNLSFPLYFSWIICVLLQVLEKYSLSWPTQASLVLQQQAFIWAGEGEASGAEGSGFLGQLQPVSSCIYYTRTITVKHRETWRAAVHEVTELDRT